MFYKISHSKFIASLLCAALCTQFAWARGGGGGGHSGGGGGGHGAGSFHSAGSAHFSGAGFAGTRGSYGGHYANYVPSGHGGNWGQAGYRTWGPGRGTGYGYGYGRWGYGWGYPGYAYGFGLGLGLGWGLGYYGGYGYPYYAYGAYGCPYMGYSSAYYNNYGAYDAGYSTGYNNGATNAGSPANGQQQNSAPYSPPPPAPARAPNDAAKTFVDQGEAAFKSGDYSKSVQHFRHAIVDDPENALITLMLGQALFASEHYEEAAGATQAALHRLSKDQWGVIIQHYGELYGKRSDYTDQLHSLENAVKAQPANPALRFLAGYHYAYLGFATEAVDQLDAAIKFAPRDEISRQLRQEMQHKIDRPTEPPAPLLPGVPREAIEK